MESCLIYTLFAETSANANWLKKTTFPHRNKWTILSNSDSRVIYTALKVLSTARYAMKRGHPELAATVATSCEPSPAAPQHTAASNRRGKIQPPLIADVGIPLPKIVVRGAVPLGCL